MANSVDLVIGTEAIKQVEGLIAKLSLADAELIKISQSALGASKGISGISTPSGLDKTVTNTANLNEELERQNKIIVELTKKIESLLKKREDENSSVKKTLKALEEETKSRQSLQKQREREIALNEKNASAYNKTQTQINNLTKAYNDLAVRKERYNNLTANEEMRLQTLAKVNEKYNGILKQTDAIIGKNQRNVGNYASGYNALGNSINQLSREAPAFANSVNTGFMALSNNFPALFDAINGIRDKNKMLVAEGKPTVSVLKSIASAVFSWQTALSVGVTLLTLYGGKLIEWIINTDKEAEALDRLTKSIKNQNDALKSANETLEHQNILAVENAKQRGASIEEIQKLDKKLAEDQLKNAQVVRDARKKDLEDYIKIEIKKRSAGTITEELSAKLRGFVLSENSVQKNAFTVAENEVKLKGKVLSELIEKQQTTLVTESNKKKAKQAKEKREDLEHLESYIKPASDIINEINLQIEKLKVIRITGTPEEREEAKKDLQTLIELKNQLMGGSPTAGSLPNIALTPIDSPHEKLKSDWKETFSAIADSAQQAGDIIAEFSQRNFDNEYRRLEAQKDISLKFAGDSAEAKAKIEADYEKKRKDIATRENRAKQRQAIFNIAIDTAQAIMATVGKTGFAGLPLALILGALGAAQIALVASQKIPQYFDGTDNHIGGMMLVNDRAGANFQEKVILPNGKEIMPQGRNVLMNAPKGTKVLTHEQQIMQMLNERGISMSVKHSQNNGMTSDQMEAIMEKTLGRRPTLNLSMDGNGLSMAMLKNGNITKRAESRGSGRGIEV